MDADGVAALYDALSSTMLRYVLSPDLSKRIAYSDEEDTNDDGVLFRILKRNRIINNRFTSTDFSLLSDLLDNAIEGKLVDFNKDLYIQIVENSITQLDVLPFEESDLPKGESVTL